MEPSDLLSPCIPIGHGTQSKVWRDGKGLILKDMRGGNPEKIQKQWEMQSAVSAVTSQTPRLIEMMGGGFFMLMEDLGDSEPIKNVALVRQSARRLLKSFRKAHVRHNDLVPANIIVRGDELFAVDYGWAQWLDEEPIQRLNDGQRLAHTIGLMTA